MKLRLGLFALGASLSLPACSTLPASDFARQPDVPCQAEVFRALEYQYPMDCEGSLTETELALDALMSQSVERMGAEAPAAPEELIRLVEEFEHPVYVPVGSPTPHGEGLHPQGVRMSDDFGPFLHLSTRDAEMRPFVPSACRAAIEGESRRIVRLAFDGTPPSNPGQLNSEDDWNFYSATSHVFRCTSNVLIRVYTYDRLVGGRDAWRDTEAKGLPLGNITEVLIYRFDGIKDRRDFRDHVRSFRRF